MLDQGIVRSSFSQAAVVEHAYLVRMHDGVQAVGDHDAGLVRQQVRERKLDPVLVLDVGEAGGFVEHDDGRILQDGAGDGYALFLAAGQRATALTHHRVVSLRQAHDEIVAAGFLGCAMISSSVAPGFPKRILSRIVS